MRELLLNLVSEGIGIAVTVILIDRIIKYRENRSWRPARRVIHRRVLHRTIELLLDFYTSRIEDEMANWDYWNRFSDDMEAAARAAVELCDETRRVADSARNQIGEEFDSSGPLIGPELRNMLQTIDEQLYYVLVRVAEVRFRLVIGLERQPPRSPAQVREALKPVVERMEAVIRTARQTESWLHTDLDTEVYLPH